MYKELEKYKTGVKVPITFDTIMAGTSSKVTVDEYVANLGELMNDFIDHKTKPFWKRKYYHKHLTTIYLKMLNELKIVKCWYY